MCLEPCQKFRKFNSDHFPFFKNLYRTSASRVSLPWLEIGSGRSGNGLRCLEPGQNFRKFNSEHFPFLKNVNPTSGSRVSIKSHKKTPHEGGRGGHFSIVKKCQFELYTLFCIIHTTLNQNIFCYTHLYREFMADLDTMAGQQCSESQDPPDRAEHTHDC